MGKENKSKIGTTDFVFKVATLKIGYDIKASRTLYTKNFSAQGAFFDIIRSVIDKSPELEIFKNSSLKDKNFLNELAYSLVNAAALRAAELDGEGNNNGLPLSSEGKDEKTKKDVHSTLQKIALTGALVRFLDEYMSSYHNEIRSQIIILLGDNVIFLSEFLGFLKEKAISFTQKGATYNLLGSASLKEKNLVSAAESSGKIKGL
jgi:hypothetical protein